LPPDERVVFFLDASLGRRIVASALREAGFEVIAHDDRFEPATPDAVWLAEAGRQSWVVLTKDQRIRYRALERRALERAQVAAFVLTGKNLTGEEMSAALRAALPRMLRLLRKHAPPFLATVGTTGSVKLVT
jgi:predicted nuclease of predicted toxin-antitoxin system